MNCPVVAPTDPTAESVVVALDDVVDRGPIGNELPEHVAESTETDPLAELHTVVPVVPVSTRLPLEKVLTLSMITALKIAAERHGERDRAVQQRRDRDATRPAQATLAKR